MNIVKFSIIIPVFNVENYLVDCLTSVVNQTYNNCEIICINDGSTDGSVDILKRFSQRYSNFRVVNQENSGLSSARNSGIRLASGDLVLFLDSDDYLETDALDRIISNYSNEDMICFSGIRLYSNDSIEIKDEAYSLENLKGWDYYNNFALKQQSFHFVSVVLRAYKRTFLLSNNLFFHEGIFHEDNLFTPIVCYYAEVVKVIPYYLYYYRIRSGSITQTYNVKRLIDSITVANLLYEFFSNKVEVDKSTLYRVISGEYFKGFMVDNIKKYGKNDKVLIRKINWQCFKSVSLYSRHKRIFFYASLNPKLLRVYLYIEFHLKIFSNLRLRRK